MLYRGPMGGGAASGAVGALVASHNAGGQYLRARTTPTDPGTTFQQAVRNAVATLATIWSQTLSDAERSGWNVYAGNVSVTNRLGDSITLSGISMFIRCNTPRLQAGQAYVPAGPGTFTLGSFLGCTLTVGAASTAGTLTFNATEDWNAATPATAGILLYASTPQSPAVNFFKGPYRFVNKLNNTTGSVTVTLPYATGPSGSRIFWRAEVSRADGRLSPTFRGFSASP